MLRKRTKIITFEAKPRWKRWLSKIFKVTVALTGLFTFVRNWGWRVLAAVVAVAVGASTLIDV